MTFELSAECIDAIARRVVELMREQAPAAAAPELVDAAEVARLLGVERSWVYDHAEDLGAIRLGDGDKPRLRFDPARISEMRAVQSSRRAPAAKSAKPEREAAVASTRTRPGARKGARSTPELLPIRGRR
jgi:hypothetical protein